MKTDAWGLTPNELANALGKMTVQGVYRILKQKSMQSASKNTRKIISSMDVRDILLGRGFEYPKQNYSFQIVKGGAGKTSLAANFCFRASHYGAKVLAIDFDQQANLTRTFSIDTHNKPVWLNLIRSENSVESAIIPIHNNLHIIPSSLNNSRLDVEIMQGSVNVREIINDILAPIRDNYDIVVMDCQPNINKINACVTCASNLIVIPINPDQYSMDGMDYTIDEISFIKKSYKLNLLDYRIVWNKYDGRERLGALYMHQLAKDEEKISKVLPVVLRTDTALKNAVFENTTIFNRSRKSTIQEDMDQLTRELLGLNTWIEAKKKGVHEESGVA